MWGCRLVERGTSKQMTVSETRRFPWGLVPFPVSLCDLCPSRGPIMLGHAYLLLLSLSLLVDTPSCPPCTLSVWLLRVTRKAMCSRVAPMHDVHSGGPSTSAPLAASCSCDTLSTTFSTTFLYFQRLPRQKGDMPSFLGLCATMQGRSAPEGERLYTVGYYLCRIPERHAAWRLV